LQRNNYLVALNAISAERGEGVIMGTQKYNQIMWEQKGEYEHLGYLGDGYYLFFKIYYAPSMIFKLTIERLVRHNEHIIDKKFDGLKEAKQYCQDVLVPKMAAIFVGDGVS